MEKRPVAQRTRLFAEMTWPEVAEAAKRGARVVLPVGSTEQHGYHLPLAPDAILATALALAIAAPLDLLAPSALSYAHRTRTSTDTG